MINKREFLATEDITLDDLGRRIPKLAAVAALDVKASQEAISAVWPWPC